MDPTEASPYDQVTGRGYSTSTAVSAAGGLAAMKKLQQLPVPSDLVIRVLDKLGAMKPKRPIIFECVGVTGIIDGIIASARDTLHMIANGNVDAAPLLTGTVGLQGVAAAFDTLSGIGAHAKILIDPTSADRTF
ncbi:MAG: hypothetical protein NVS3B12_05090 [Acidimicrobiales bacterium]